MICVTECLCKVGVYQCFVILGGKTIINKQMNNKTIIALCILVIVFFCLSQVSLAKRHGKKHYKKQAEIQSDAMLGAGSTLQVTEALRVRNGPCTDKGIITELPAGSKVTYTGASSNSCGYTWHQVRGSFGTGYAASNWLREVSNAGAEYQVTEALRVRNGPCTDRGIITELPTGARVTLTGETHTACGYTWLGVRGGFGSGFAASNWLVPAGNAPAPSGAQCRTRGYPLFKQCGQEWSGNGMGRSGISMCREGCLVSSISMALNGLGKTINGQSANPGTLNAWLGGNGGYVNGNDFIWASVGRLGLNHVKATNSNAEIRAAICANQVVILTVKNGGHYVLATGTGNGVFYVNDPGSNTSGTYTDGQVVLAHIYNY
jgi:uncharacterized protein YraI